MNLNNLSADVYRANKEKGFWEDREDLIEKLKALAFEGSMTFEEVTAIDNAMKAQSMSLIASEAHEAIECLRKNEWADDALVKALLKEPIFDANEFKSAIKDTVGDELADVVIRVLDFCGGYNIDLDAHVKLKLQYNASRPHKHGKNF